MIKIISNPKIRYKYVVQVPDKLDDRKYQVVFAFHGSMNTSEEEMVNEINRQYEQGRYRFIDEVQQSSIFITPIITRKHVHLSNGLEVDPQRFTRGCMHKLCKLENPEDYNPTAEVKKIIENLLSDLDLEINLKERVIVTGISAGGSFANSFAFLYPELVESAISFLNGEIVIPTREYKGLELLYPFGLAGLEECPDLGEINVKEYLKIQKLHFVDRDDHHNEVRKSSLYSAITPEFCEKYTEIFGTKLYEQAYNLSNLLNSEFNDRVELVITNGRGHKIDNEDFDAHMERFIRKSLHHEHR